jgi:molybdate transport system substrate-binding protein
MLASQAMSAQGLRIAAASDLQAVLPALVTPFEKQSGRKLSLTFGSSGNFFTQIQNGAPFDVFMSADVDYPRQLEQAGQAERGSLYAYATGHLVLWTRNDSGIDIRRGLAALTDAKIKHIAVANPQHAPYGRAAMAALRHEGLYDRIQAKFVLGENISQTAQFAQSGGAEVGVLSLSLAFSPALKNSGLYVEIPEAWYPAIEQAAIIVSSSKEKTLARQFLDYLKRPETVRMLQSFGFGLPQPVPR